MLDAGPRRHGRLHADRPGDRGPERGGRVPARQPPARLPGLRQGRRVPAAGHRDGLGPRAQQGHRPEATLPQADPALAAGPDRPRALHPLLPLRALQPGGRRGRAAPAARARGVELRRHLRRPPLHRPLPRQHHRALPGGRAHLRGLPLPGPPLGHRGLGLDLHPVPEPVQREVHGSRRPRAAGARPRQPRGRQRLALRQGPVRLSDDRLRGADHRAAGERRARRLEPDPRRGGRAAARRRPEGGRDRRRPGIQRGGLVRPADRARARRGRRDHHGRASGRRPSRPLGPRPLGLDRRPRPRRVGAGHRHRPAALDADPRPAAAQGSPPRRARGSSSPPSARPRSTAAPRRRPATRPAARPHS